jgi:hypothetical protein
LAIYIDFVTAPCAAQVNSWAMLFFYSGSPKNPHGESPPFPQLEETEVLFEMEKKSAR